jgi:glycosyltransferase involved in cell wall biosynthesis
MPPELPSLDSLLAEWGVQWKLNEDRLVRRYRDRPQELLVSVIMPTWDRASIIHRAIDSVLGQSYGRLELLVSDDGSRDGTEKLLQGRYGGDTRLRYLPGSHQGVSHARNRALEAARGRIIAYLDSDDTWSEHFLLVSVNALADHPEAESLYSGVRIVDSPGEKERYFHRSWDRKALLRRNFIFVHTFLHTRALFEELGGFREELRALEDWELILRFTRRKAPVVLDCCLVDYFNEEDHQRLTAREDLGYWWGIVREIHGE